MNFIRFFLLFFLINFISCKDLRLNNNAKTSKQKAIEQLINYNSIDAYPLLPECTEITNRILQKDCFYTKIASRIQNTLDNNFLEFTNEVEDTVFVKIIVSVNGKTTVKAINMSEVIKNNIPKLDSLIRNSIDQLPNLDPAIKTGIPVKAEFTLPIKIN